LNDMVNAAAFPRCQLDQGTSHALPPNRVPASEGTLSGLPARYGGSPHKTVAQFGKTAYFWNRLEKPAGSPARGEIGETIGAAMQPGGLTPPVLVKRYAGRRLYRPATSAYLSREDLITMATNGEPFVVIDAATQEDVTRSYRPIIIEH
jgi:hypothetical protein